SLTTTCAPAPASASACSRPIPRPAPVTIATFPSSLGTGASVLMSASYGAPLVARRAAPVRRHRRARRRLARGGGGTDRGADRPERCGQDDGVQRDHTPLPAGLRRNRLRRPVAAADAAAPSCAPRDRAHLPERGALPDDDRARERARRRSFR